MRSPVRLTIIAVVVATALVLGLTAFAGSNSDVRTITVTATGTVQAAPDLAELDLGVNTEAATAKEALAKNNSATRALIAALKAQGIADKDLQTQNVSVYPKTDANGNENGFTATNSLHVKIRDVAKAGAIVEAAVAAGGNVVSGPMYSREATDKLYEQALDKAYDEAREKAEALAGHAGQNLGKPVDISESAASGPVPYALEAGKAADTGVPLEPGQTEVSASVTVAFELT